MTNRSQSGGVSRAHACLRVASLAVVALTLSLIPSAEAFASEVDDGTSLSDLGVEDPVALDNETTTRVLDGLVIPSSATSVDADKSLVVETVVTFTLAAMPEVEQLEESRLSFSLNGKTVVQYRIVTTPVGVSVHSNGWVDLDPNVTLEEGGTSEVRFANYAQYDSTAELSDQLEIFLDLSPALAPHLNVEILPQTNFQFDVNPAAVVTLEIDSIDVDSSSEQVRVEYEVRSERAQEARMMLLDVSGISDQFANFTEDGSATTSLTLVNGIARGTAFMELTGSEATARGTLVAVTDFNSPAEELVLGEAQVSRKINWPIIGLIAFMSALFIRFRVLPTRSADEAT